MAAIRSATAGFGHPIYGIRINYGLIFNVKASPNRTLSHNKINIYFLVLRIKTQYKNLNAMIDEWRSSGAWQGQTHIIKLFDDVINECCFFSQNLPSHSNSRKQICYIGQKYPAIGLQVFAVLKHRKRIIQCTHCWWWLRIVVKHLTAVLIIKQYNYLEIILHF